ncbi:MAG TPA: hypothetical protein PKO15_04680 [Fibrobacteria bacterium]|nr:hypothetical protein [Fibrobacteria bacterium]
MVSIALAFLLHVSASPRWIPAGQPAGQMLQTATVLSDGRWFGTDTAYRAWISEDRGASWRVFVDGRSDSFSWTFGDGVVVSDPDDPDDLHSRYEPAEDAWRPMVFDRALVGEGSGHPSSLWTRRGEGNYLMALFRDDSVLAFRSTDSARTWKTLSVVPVASVAGGATQGRTNFAGSRLWLTDTVRRVFRSPKGDGGWLEIPFPPLEALRFQVFDSLPDGRWVVFMAADARVAVVATRDLGATWERFDAVSPDSIPGVRIAMSDGWTMGVAIRSDTTRVFVRRGDAGIWREVPRIAGKRMAIHFVDGGYLHATGDSGLVRLDLKELEQVSNRPRARRADLRWRWQGAALVVEGVRTGRTWQLGDSRGRILGSSRPDASGALRFEWSRATGGVFFLREVGSCTWSEPILAR